MFQNNTSFLLKNAKYEFFLYPTHTRTVKPLDVGTSIKWAVLFGPNGAHTREVLLYRYSFYCFRDERLEKKIFFVDEKNLQRFQDKNKPEKELVHFNSIRLVFSPILRTMKERTIEGRYAISNFLPKPPSYLVPITKSKS